jgi:transmembrane sensor
MMGTDKEPSIASDSSAAEQAYEWFDALREGGPQVRAEFAAWLKASPRHVGEFLAVTAMYRAYSGLDPQKSIDVEALIAEVSSNVVPLAGPRGPGVAFKELDSANAGRSWILPAAAASIVGLAVAGWLLVSGSLDSRRYENAIGEVRSFELEDGSVIHLNTRSKVQVQLSKEMREVELLAGEALFKVARDPARPFRVHAGSATIQALGTQFNVYRRIEGTTISVIEGAVRVSGDAVKAEKKELSAGQETRVSTDGEIAGLTTTDMAEVTAWRERRLIFRDDTLADIAAEFNRYNERPRFRVEGADTAALRFTGVFDAEAPESFVRVLGGVGNLVAEKHGNEVVIRRR